MVIQAAKRPDLIDAICWNKFSQTWNYESWDKAIYAKYCVNTTFLTMKDQDNKHRYVLNGDGIGAAFRVFKIMSSGMVPIFPVDNNYEEHFYPLLRPWRDYVPMGTWDLAKTVEFLRSNDAFARHIALNAMKFASRNLLLKPTMCYSLQVWRRMAKLQEGLDWKEIERVYGAFLAEKGFKTADGEDDIAKRPFVKMEDWLKLPKPKGW